MHVDIYRGQDLADGFRRKTLREAPFLSAAKKVALLDGVRQFVADVDYLLQEFELDGSYILAWRPLGVDVPTVGLITSDEGMHWFATRDIGPVSTEGLIRFDKEDA